VERLTSNLRAVSLLEMPPLTDSTRLYAGSLNRLSSRHEESGWRNIIARRCKKPSEKPHERANLLTINRVIAK
jgi:hypothetical protein